MIFICFHTYHRSNCRDIDLFSHVSGGPVLKLSPAFHLPCGNGQVGCHGEIGNPQQGLHPDPSFSYLSVQVSAVECAAFSLIFRASQKERDNLLNLVS